MGGLTGSGVTAAAVTAALVTNDRVTGPPDGAAGDPDIDAYSLTSANVSATLVGNNHGSSYLSLAGDRVYFDRQSSFQSFQYELTTLGDISSLTGNFEGTQNWKFLSQFMRSISLTPDRSKAYKIRTGSGGTFFVSADPFSTAALGDPAQNPYQLLNTENNTVIPPNPATSGAFVAAPNNLDLYIQSAAAGDRGIYHWQMSVAGDASTATSQGKVLDLDSKFSVVLYGIFYSPDGSKLFVLGDNAGTLSIAQFDLSPAYDVTTAVDSGKSLVVTPAQVIRLSLSVWENPLGGFKLYLTSMPNINGTNLRIDTYDAP